MSPARDELYTRPPDPPLAAIASIGRLARIMGHGLEDNPHRPLVSAGGQAPADRIHDAWVAGWLETDRALADGEPVCSSCGCTSRQSCPGGCIWAGSGFCSRCVDILGALPKEAER